MLEFGRFAAVDRRKRGEKKPETFTFLGFIHQCGTSPRGLFVVWRQTANKRMVAKLKHLALTSSNMARVGRFYQELFGLTSFAGQRADGAMAATDGYVSLALLLASEHRFDEIEPTLEAMVKASPKPATYFLAAREMKDLGNDAGARAFRTRGERLAAAR